MNTALRDPQRDSCVDWRLDYHEELASTSDFCASQAKAGAAAGLAVMAGRQTAGRGSRGRNWVAPPGNLSASFLLRPSLPAAEAGVFALLAGLAAAEALAESLPPDIAVSLKWPNDLLLGNAKLGGILIDASPNGAGLDWLVIGIGINLRAAPEIEGRMVTSLAAHNVDLSAGVAFAAVLGQLKKWLDILAISGVLPIHEAWLAHAHPIGAPLSVQSGQSTFAGRFAGLSPAGELLLHVDNRIERINTGEVMLAIGPKR